jgi:hypothetical protein
MKALARIMWYGWVGLLGLSASVVHGQEQNGGLNYACVCNAINPILPWSAKHLGAGDVGLPRAARRR